MVSTDLAINRLQYFYKTNHRMPTYGELQKLFRYKSKSPAQNLVKRLVEEGIVEKDQEGKLVPKNLPITIPHYGLIKAGYPQEALNEVVEQIAMDAYLIYNFDHCFMLTVSGDSMINAGLFDGDMVIVDYDVEPRNGNIVAAYVDREWTLKFLENKDGKIRLIPANPKFQPIEPKESLEIAGVVVSSVRKYH